MSRRGNRNTLVVIYWRDIPAQVTVGDEKVLLDARFQHAIDRAAIVADKTDTSSYVAEWRREAEPVSEPASGKAAHRAAELDAAHTNENLESLVRNGGLAIIDASSADLKGSSQ